MPELPEVELVARSLEKLVSKKRIAAAGLLRERLAPDTPPSSFSDVLTGSTINFVHRRGKHVLFNLDCGYTLLTHLRMTGRFLLLPADRNDPRFTHAVLQFEDDTRLIFQDQRHFGHMNLVRTDELQYSKEIRKLAPEPLSESFSPGYFRSVLRSSKRVLKELLLDQTKVCGLGNIYAAEALFLARIHPAKRADKLSGSRSHELYAQIRKVLSDAIVAGSTLNVDPENIDGSYYGGVYESHWRVYDRENLPCPECGSPITRLKQAGRSTFFCPKCQKK